jgi:hypothetical protein
MAAAPCNRRAMVQLDGKADGQVAIAARRRAGQQLSERGQVVVEGLAVLGRSGAMVMQEPTRTGGQCVGLGG